MMTLFGSLLGFLSAAFPDFLNLFKDYQDRKHELKILELQLEQQAQGHSQRLEEIQISADIAESNALYKHASRPSGYRLGRSSQSLCPSYRDLFIFLVICIHQNCFFIGIIIIRIQHHRWPYCDLGCGNTGTFCGCDVFLVWSACTSKNKKL